LPIDDPVKSLNQPLSDDTDATLGDILPDIPDTNVALKQRVEAALEAVSLIVDEKKRWAFRLGLITQAPLSDEEICTLARFNGSSLDALKVRLAPVLAALERREHERENFGKIAIQLWHELRRLEAQLCDGFFRPDAEDAETLEDAIMALSARREEHLQKSQKHIRPTNKEIAMLIGMPFAQSDQISTILLRERSFLEGLMTKHAKTGCL